MRSVDNTAVGDVLPPLERRLEQGDLIRYAGASGDYNPLHWDPGFAARVSPTGGVIAHGMLNMGLVSEVVTRWAGGPEHVTRLDVTFRKPCPVGTKVTVGGEVTDVDAETGTVTLRVWVEGPAGERLVDRRRSSAVVRLPT